MDSPKDKKQIFTTEKGVLDKENNKLIGVIGSTGSIDRHGESVNPMGWILTNYLKNPVIQWAHDYSTLPVGKAERVYIEDNALKFDIKFADTAFAKEVFSLFTDGILNAFSVGFIPKKWGVSGQDVYDIMEQELLELSVVPVPANPEALALIKSMEAKYEIKEVTEETPVVEEEIVEVTPTDEVPEEVVIDEEEVTEVPDEIVPPVEETPIEPVEEEKPVEEVLPEGEKPSEEKPVEEKVEEKQVSPETLALLKEMTNLFKKADNEVGQGLAILKQLKSALQN